jgi:hypothetical protein
MMDVKGNRSKTAKTASFDGWGELSIVELGEGGGYYGPTSSTRKSDIYKKNMCRRSAGQRCKRK